ncbi:MAG: type IV toxin-antitoxin system AbiEi family antitoxin domain-containing protein [Deltaproteobacteria bacterium]
MGAAKTESPDWTALYATAETQAGFFTTAQAHAAGFSLPLLHKYLKNGRVIRERRGIYRLVHFPSSEHEALVVLWLWSGQAGVFSHETALMLHELSDVLPVEAHLTVPESWCTRRLRVPADLVLHYAAIDATEQDWVGPVPVSGPRRTIVDCIDAHVSPELIESAINDAHRRGLFSRRDEAALRRRLAAALGGT